MRLNELIKELQQIQADEGDVEVLINKKGPLNFVLCDFPSKRVVLFPKEEDNVEDLS